MIPQSAHKLITVPGASSADDEDDGGPGGVIVLCENYLVHYKNDKEIGRCSIPIRYDQSKKQGLMFTCA